MWINHFTYLYEHHVDTPEVPTQTTLCDNRSNRTVTEVYVEQRQIMNLYLFKSKGTPNRPEGPEGDRGIELLFLDLGARRVWVVSTTPRSLYPRENPVPIAQEVGWAPGPVWTWAIMYLYLRVYKSKGTPNRPEGAPTALPPEKIR
jgi:hypothetical protein